MNIEDQVVSLELAKKLKETGVEQKSLWKWFHNKYFGTTSLKRHDEIPLPLKKDEDIYSAFTVAEMMEKLPPKIQNRYMLVITKNPILGYHVAYQGLVAFAREGFADALAEMLIWLVERGYVEVK